MKNSYIYIKTKYNLLAVQEGPITFEQGWFISQG